MCLGRKFSVRWCVARCAFGVQWSVAGRCKFGNETAKRGKIQRHGNKIQHNEFIKASTANGTRSTTNSTKYGEFGNANSAKRYFVCEKCTTQQAQQIQCGKPLQAKQHTTNSAWQAWRNGQVFVGRSRQSENGVVFGRGTSLSLSFSLSLLALVARLWAKFKGIFYSFHRSFISFYCKFFLFYRNFISSYRKFFLFYRSFNSSFCLQKAFFRTLCFFEIFKRFIYALLRPFCHFERSDPTGCKAQAAAKKSTQIKRKLAIYGYFAIAQYDKIYDAKSVWYDKFGLLSKNNGYFHSNFRDKIYKFYSFFWIATLALLARNDGKAKIQIFYSKFNSFHKFHSKFKAFHKFNSFHKFISNFKPCTRLFHIFTPSFRSVQTDKKFFTRRTLCLNRNF